MKMYELSERARKRVSNPLPKPTNCHSCGSDNIRITTNDAIYGKCHGSWPIIWICVDCQAAVSCHPQTEIPVGFMADRDTRQMRRRVHKAFDPLWKQGARSRQDAYYWLAKQMDMSPKVCHISYFDVPLCEKALKILELYRRGKIS